MELSASTGSCRCLQISGVWAWAGAIRGLQWEITVRPNRRSARATGYPPGCSGTAPVGFVTHPARLIANCAHFLSCRICGSWKNRGAVFVASCGHSAKMRHNNLRAGNTSARCIGLVGPEVGFEQDVKEQRRPRCQFGRGLHLNCMREGRPERWRQGPVLLVAC